MVAKSLHVGVESQRAETLPEAASYEDSPSKDLVQWAQMIISNSEHSSVAFRPQISWAEGHPKANP